MSTTNIVIEIALLLLLIAGGTGAYFNIRELQRLILQLHKILEEAYNESHHTVKCFSNDRRPGFCTCWKHEAEKLLNL